MPWKSQAQRCPAWQNINCERVTMPDQTSLSSFHGTLPRSGLRPGVYAQGNRSAERFTAPFRDHLTFCSGANFNCPGGAE
jgi:hypothetical protein